MVSNILYFHAYLGKWSNLTNIIFQMGWFNHKLVAIWPELLFMCVFLSVSWELWNVINFNPPKNGGFSSIFFRSVKPPQFGGTWMCGSVDVDSDAWTQGLGCPHFRVPPRKLTSNLKITTLERKIIFKPYIFRFHVSFRGCTWWWFCMDVFYVPCWGL